MRLSFPSLFEIRQLFQPETQNSVKKGEMGPEEGSDSFEPAIWLPQKAAQIAINTTFATLEKVESTAKSLLCFLGSDQGLGRRVREISYELHLLRRDCLLVAEIHDKGYPVASSSIIGLRRKLWDAQNELEKFQIKHVSLSLGICGLSTQSKIEALVVIQSLLDGDIDFAARVLKSCPLELARRPLLSDYDILRRFDSKLLKSFAEKGFVDSMSFTQREELEAQLKRLPELENKFKKAAKECEKLEQKINEFCGEKKVRNDLIASHFEKLQESNQLANEVDKVSRLRGQLEKQFYLRDHFYLVSDYTKPMFKRLVTLLDQAGIAIASRQNLDAQIIKNLFRGHFELFRGLGIIEALTANQLYEQASKGFCDVREFSKRGNDNVRIANAGVYLLKAAVELTPHRVPPKPMVEAEKPDKKIRSKKSSDFEGESPEAVKRPAGYARMVLEESVEFY